MAYKCGYCGKTYKTLEERTRCEFRCSGITSDVNTLEEAIKDSVGNEQLHARIRLEAAFSDFVDELRNYIYNYECDGAVISGTEDDMTLTIMEDIHGDEAFVLKSEVNDDEGCVDSYGSCSAEEAHRDAITKLATLTTCLWGEDEDNAESLFDFITQVREDIADEREDDCDGDCDHCPIFAECSELNGEPDGDFDDFDDFDGDEFDEEDDGEEDEGDSEPSAADILIKKVTDALIEFCDAKANEVDGEDAEPEDEEADDTTEEENPLFTVTYNASGKSKGDSSVEFSQNELKRIVIQASPSKDSESQVTLTFDTSKSKATAFGKVLKSIAAACEFLED